MSTASVYSGMQTLTVNIDSNMDDYEYLAANLDTAEDDLTINAATAATAFPFPVVEALDGSSTAGVGSIAVSGITKVRVGGSVTPGATLTATSNSRWIATTTDGQHYGAIALEVGVNGDIIRALVVQGIRGV